MEKKEINQAYLSGERALFNAHDLIIKDTIFDDGESPLKESYNIDVQGTQFKWKYPLWYSNNIHVDNSTWHEMGRSGVWYTNNITVENSMIDAPKNFRRCKGVTLKNVSFSNAEETLWNCNGIHLENVIAKGDYFGMNTNNIYIEGLNLYGNYCFDGSKNIEIRNSKLMSKDAFWNTENVIVYDSYIYGEYLAWNAKNITFVNCTIESLQGLCYIENLKMINCKLINTTLAFEYSSVDADISSSIKSVMNPTSGTITADSIGELILEKDYVDPTKTVIICKDGLPINKENDYSCKNA